MRNEGSDESEIERECKDTERKPIRTLLETPRRADNRRSCEAEPAAAEVEAAAAERSIAAGASGAEAPAAAAEARGCCAETTRPAVETPREMQAATMVEGGETKKGGREEMREKTRKSLVCRRRSK